MYLCLLDGGVKELLSEKLTIFKFLGAFNSLAEGALFLTEATYYLSELAIGIDNVFI